MYDPSLCPIVRRIMRRNTLEQGRGQGEAAAQRLESATKGVCKFFRWAWWCDRIGSQRTRSSLSWVRSLVVSLRFAGARFEVCCSPAVDFWVEALVSCGSRSVVVHSCGPVAADAVFVRSVAGVPPKSRRKLPWLGLIVMLIKHNGFQIWRSLQRPLLKPSQLECSTNCINQMY